MKKNNAKKNDRSNLFVLITMLLVVIFLLFIPSIYNFVEKSKLPKVESNKDSQKDENKEVEEEVLESIHYPIMRTDIYSTNTYYSLDKFKISDMSNNDILVNAFLDIYEGNMTPYSGYSKCSTNSKQFNKDYLTLLKSENEFLKEQLEEKDKQISELHKLIENSQILLKEEQKKSEQQLYLAEHFEEVDNKLQDLKEKMEQKRNEKIKIFKIFSK